MKKLNVEFESIPALGDDIHKVVVGYEGHVVEKELPSYPNYGNVYETFHIGDESIFVSVTVLPPRTYVLVGVITDHGTVAKEGISLVCDYPSLRIKDFSRF